MLDLNEQSSVSLGNTIKQMLHVIVSPNHAHFTTYTVASYSVCGVVTQQSGCWNESHSQSILLTWGTGSSVLYEACQNAALSQGFLISVLW